MALSDIKRPVGTVEELQKDSMDISVIPTCARPTEGVVGCARWMKCNLSIKGKSGPRNFAVAEFKSDDLGGATLTNERDCQWIAQYKESVEDNGGVLKVVAAEGGEYQTRTSVATGKIAPSGMAERTYQHITKTVAPYKRLRANEHYDEHMQRVDVRKQWRNQKDAEREERIIGGHDGPAEPLDAGLIPGSKGSGSKK